MPGKAISRRVFLGGALAGAGFAACGRPGRAFAARVGMNDKVRLGVIGCGSMGNRHLEALCVNPNCSVAAVCDVFTPRYEAAMGAVERATGKRPEGYQDFRRVLDRKDIDAILCPTHDNWHSLLTIMGCEAGKDVYVEKPAAPTVVEGRAMVNAARRYGRVVQVGTQQRSMAIFRQAMDVLHGGAIGRITSATAWVGVNVFGFQENVKPVPEGLDWDMWLGPAPKVPYSPERYFGHMGWWDYCRGGQLANWGVHLIDVLQWGMGEDRPLSVQATGGSYLGGAGAVNYETIEAIFEYKGCTATWEQRHSNTYGGRAYGMKFQGTKGQLLLDRNTFEVLPEDLGIHKYVGEGERSWASPQHHNDFFDCIRTRRRPVADIEQGVRSTTSVLLAGIALRVRRKLNWDGATERILHDEAANRYLTRAYRAPWHLDV